MQRARRLASTAVVAVLAVTGLSACRAEPGVAAYVSGSTISEKSVKEIWLDAKGKLDKGVTELRAERERNPDPAQQPIPEVVELKLTQGDVLEAMLGVRLLKDITAERKVQPAGAVDPAQMAAQYGLPADTKYIGLLAEYQGYLNSLVATAKPAELTEAQNRDVYERLTTANGAENPISFEEFKRQVLTPENTAILQRTYGLRADLESSTDKANITVNPRYGPGELPLLPLPTEQGGSVSLVSLPFDTDASSPVADRS